MSAALTEEQIITIRRIRQILHEIQKYTANDNARWSSSELLLHVVMRKLQLISQMVYRLPVELKDSHPEVRWQRWLTFHSSGGYMFIEADMTDIEQLIQDDLPALMRAVDDLLSHTTHVPLG